MLRNALEWSRGLIWILPAALLAVPVSADEGMWVYNNLPRQELIEKYSFDASPQWIDHLMKSSVRFNNGGSGSFISSTGLVLTNHHVGADTLHKISTAQHDYYAEGYYAKTQAEERSAPDLELNQLISIEDVTARVNAAVKPGMTADEAAQARRAAQAQIEKESLEHTGLRSDVITLYQGGQYQLYRYKKYTDVRLVFAPEFGAAFFGGDPDNFEFPRFDLDMCIFRVYENGRPVHLDSFLKWSASGAAENELIFVSGNPGTTRRLFTTDALRFLRDLSMPFTLNWTRRKEITLQQFGGQGAAQDMESHEELFGVQNSRKVYLGELRGLQDERLIASKQKSEYSLRAQVLADPKLKQYAGAWDEIAATYPIYGKILKRYALLEVGYAFNSQLFTIARQLVRIAAEDQKPNDQRLAEYRDSNRASLEQQLFSEAPLYDDFDIAKLGDSLSFLAEQLGEDDPLVQRLLQGKSPFVRAREVISGTSLKATDVRRLLEKSGPAGIQESYDPMIELAQLVDDDARAVRKVYENQVVEPQRQGYAKIASALFALKGTDTYPDATFSLRLAFGTVKGYEEGGNQLAPFTTLGGAFQHEADHAGKDPWQLPKRWHEKKDSLNLNLHLNFVSTADIIGGNSGSPVVNRAGELVGLIFDGNSHSLTSDLAYDEVQSRAIAVDTNAMMEALRKIYDASALADELGK